MSNCQVYGHGPATVRCRRFSSAALRSVVEIATSPKRRGAGTSTAAGRGRGADVRSSLMRS